MSEEGVIVDPILKETGLYHCPSCDHGFKQRSNASAHFKSVHLNVKTKCPQCGKLVKKLKHHIRDVHTSKRFVQCQICDNKYQEGRLFKDHMNKTHMKTVDGDPLEKYLNTSVCNVCHEVVSTARLNRHLKLRHFLPSHYVVECPLCSIHVKWLTWHLAKQHRGDKAVGNLHRCKKCDHYFLSATFLAEHLANHEEYRCPDCNSHYPTHFKLARHLYGVHQKVFNVGKQFKSSRNQWEMCLGSKSVLYSITTSSNPKVLSSKDQNEQINKNEIATNKSSQQLAEPVKFVHIEDQIEYKDDSDESFTDEDMDESFTVLLDEHGNLQEIVKIKSENDALVQQPIERETTIELILEVAAVGENLAMPYNNITEEINEEFNQNKSEESSNNKQSDIHLVLSSQLTKNSANVTGNDDPINKTKQSENKLFERTMRSRQELPRSFNGIELSAGDEKALTEAPSANNINKKDLSQFQIGNVNKAGKPNNKYETCPSRQAHLCPYCRQVLKTRDALSRHISVIHLNVKNFSCDQCDKSYATKADAMKHKKSAHGEKRNLLVACETCGEMFKQCYLKRHQYYKHKGSNLSKECPDCNKIFKSREIMMKHIRKIHRRQ